MSGNYVFKFLGLSDWPRMMAIERSSFDNPWSAQVMRDSLAAAHTRSIGLFVDSIMIGYVLLSIVLDEAEILSMTIHPQYQGQGFGTALLTEGINEAFRLGAKMLYLEVRKNHPTAIHLYKKLGFIEMGIRPNYYPNIHTGKPDDALLMSLTLTEGFSNK